MRDGSVAAMVALQYPAEFPIGLDAQFGISVLWRPRNDGCDSGHRFGGSNGEPLSMRSESRKLYVGQTLVMKGKLIALNAHFVEQLERKRRTSLQFPDTLGDVGSDAHFDK
jgi:hypothetical protein